MGHAQPEVTVEQILEDCLTVAKFIRELGIKNEEVIIYGRSIGSGFALQLVTAMESYRPDEGPATSPIACLILMSPFLSIRTLAIDLIDSIITNKSGQSSPSWTSYALGFVVRERLCSKEAIKQISCPCFIIHGLRDTLVPYTHAKQLHEICGSEKQEGHQGTECSLLLSASMSHNEFDMEQDFIEPFGYFTQSN